MQALAGDSRRKTRFPADQVPPAVARKTRPPLTVTAECPDLRALEDQSAKPQHASAVLASGYNACTTLCTVWARQRPEIPWTR